MIKTNEKGIAVVNSRDLAKFWNIKHTLITQAIKRITDNFSLSVEQIKYYPHPQRKDGSQRYGHFEIEKPGIATVQLHIDRIGPLKQHEAEEMFRHYAAKQDNTEDNSTNDIGPIVKLNDKGVPVADSLHIAEVFGKEHKHVLEAIRNLECSKEFNESNFRPVDYIDNKGEVRPCVEMTRDGFTFLAMGFRGKKAAKFKEDYIAAFNLMEEELKRQSEKPMSDAERLLLQAQINVKNEQELKRLDDKTNKIEAKVDSFEKTAEKLEAQQERLSKVEPATVEIPPATRREQVRTIVNEYADKHGYYGPARGVLWRRVWNRFEAVTGKRAGSYKGKMVDGVKVNSKLDFAVAAGFVEEVYAIALEMFVNGRAA